MPALIAITCLMFTVWLVGVWKRDVSIVDILWGLGFVVVAWIGLVWQAGPVGNRAWLLTALTTLWGIRLSAYLAWRNLGKAEDYRYQAMRERIGDRFWIISLVTVFGLQGAVMWIVSLPIQFGQSNDSPLGWLDATGAVIWLTGWLFESIGDFQLARFKANPDNRGQVFSGGLWRYTRHPNYFGDFLVWWGIFLIAAGGGAWWTVISPLLMSFLLIRVSGVALLERALHQRRDGYGDYVRRTSAFFPWPPRQPNS